MRKILIVLALCLVLIPAAASADIIQYNGIQQPGLKVEGKIDDDRVRVDNLGEFDVTWDEKEVLVAYCADILQHGVGGVYDVNALSSYDPVLNNNLYRAAWIMENYTPALGYPDDPEVAATAVQSAIWTLLPTRPDPWVLTKVRSGSKSQRSKAKDLYATVLSESAAIDFSSYTFANDFFWGESQQDNQDLLFATPGSGVPEPATLLLVGSALGGLWGYRRRRRKAAS